MYELLESEGFGAIKFGMKPSQVKKAWKQDLFYEDWMGGNLENFLYFRGLLVGFSGECEDAPTENSNACMFLIKSSLPIKLWGKCISKCSFKEISYLIKDQGIASHNIAENGIALNTGKLRFQFDQSGLLDQVHLLKADT